MIAELIELTLATLSSGVVGYTFGKKKGKTEPLAKEQDLEKELAELDKFLDPYSNKTEEGKEEISYPIID